MPSSGVNGLIMMLRGQKSSTIFLIPQKRRYRRVAPRFISPARAALEGMGDTSVNWLYQAVAAPLTMGVSLIPDIIVGNAGKISDAVYDALAAARDAAYRVAGKLSPAEKQRIDSENIGNIIKAAGGNTALANQAIAQYKNEVAVVYAGTEAESGQANFSKFLIIGGLALAIYLVATR
jgi:hypothetical protein